MASQARTSSVGVDRRRVIQELEAQLARTPKAVRPHEHAALAYRLGLAHAEAPAGTPEAGLRKALSYFDVAAAIFDPRYDPVEHARVLNGAGAAHRALGDRPRAAKLFEQAADLLEHQGRDDERAGVLNNLGLARTEVGQPQLAVAACDAAIELFDRTSAEGRRGRIAALHTRGMAHAALGGDEGLEAALADYRQAADEIDAEEAPYHHGLVQHSIGTTYSALAARQPDQRERLIGEAVAAFEESLSVFTRSAFPFQHALAKHNLGLARLALGGPSNLRRALASFEDAVSMLDPRMHAEAWKQAYANLERVEKELEQRVPGGSRADHFAALLAVCDPEERRALLHERISAILDLPAENRRRSALTELALASAGLDPDDARSVMESELDVLIELPPEQLQLGLRARLGAHRRLHDDEAREQAERAFDQAISDALQGPQRIAVRDFLYSIGWERP
jgi:tetratricopeptide (TPR) repeat protein